MDSFEAHPLCGYQETVEELRTNLWSTSWELEELRSSVKEEIRKKDEDINHLIHMLNEASQQRDEARERVQVLLNYLKQSNSVDFFPAAAPFQQAGCSSSFTESENLSNIHSHNDDAATSIELSNVHINDSCNAPTMRCAYDPMESKLNQLLKRPLPERGRLLQAVMDAGPLLRTLMVVGDLPAWRNPPHLKDFSAFPMAVKYGSYPILDRNSLES